MTICKVLSSLEIGDNTAIVVDSGRELFKNGVGILDENGKPFEVISVGIDKEVEVFNEEKASLLIEGKFTSSKVFI